MESKNEAQLTTTAGDDVPVHKGHVPIKYMGTAADQLDMRTLGREQVLRVRKLHTLPLF